MPSASAWATQARLDAPGTRCVAAGQAVIRRAEAATAPTATRAALLRNAPATSDGLRAGDAFRCREAAPV